MYVHGLTHDGFAAHIDAHMHGKGTLCGPYAGALLYACVHHHYNIDSFCSPLPRLSTLGIEILKRVNGHIVEFPYEFLSGEYLGPGMSSKEAWVPAKTFT